MGLVINTSYDSSVNNAPAAFKAAVAYVVAFFESVFNNPVTINIDVGYGEVNGQPLAGGALGESVTLVSNFTYSQIRSALLAGAISGDQSTAVGALPSVDPIGGNYWLATAEAKALGLLSDSGSIDGFIGFSSTEPFTYDPNNRAVPGEYDFIGVVAHEISEVLGRALFVGETIGYATNSYSLLDLFHYSSPGVLDLSGTQAGYFSIDGGNTSLDNFNTNPSGDFGDWAATAGNDSFLAFSNSGAANIVSPTDLRELNVLGYAFSMTTVGSGVTHRATGIESSLVLSGGFVVVTHGATIVDAVIESGGFDVISSGGAADATTLSGTEFVLFGGTANTTRVEGGIQAVEPGGFATGTIVNSGHEVVLSGGVTSNTTVNGGDNLIADSGLAVSTTVNGGGLEVAEVGGTVVSSTVYGVEVVFGSVVRDIVGSGGFQVVWGSGASASTTTVDSRGFDFIVRGTGNDTVLMGSEFVLSGGVANFTDVRSGGVQVVSSLAYSATVESGGVQLVESGGIATDTTVETLGYAYVGSAGTADAVIIDGGAVEFASGGSAGKAAITFTRNGGDLQLDASQSLHGSIAGFGSPLGVTEQIDLRDIVFGSGTTLSYTEAGNNLSGSLTVSDGMHTASLTLLGQFTAGNFTLSSDGHGGTMITDPPALVGSAGSPVLAAGGFT